GAPCQRVGGERAVLPRRAHHESLGADVEHHGSGPSVLGGFVPLLPREEAFHLLPLPRVEMADGSAETLTVVEFAESGAHGLLRGALHPEIAGGGDLGPELVR